MVAVTKTMIMKFVELAVSSVVLGLHVNSLWSHDNDQMMMVASGGYIIILVGLLISSLTDNPANRVLELYFIVVGCILFLVGGIIFLERFSTLTFDTKFRRLGLSKGALSIIQAIIFVIDGFLTYKGETAGAST